MINLLGLIQMYNTYAPKDVYHEVAACLLKNYQSLDKLSSEQIAGLCNVSSSTLYRFFKKMDYPLTVSKLSEIVSETKDNYILEGNYIHYSGIKDNISSIDFYIDSIYEGISNLHNSIDQKNINKFVQDIYSCKKVVFIGYPIQAVWRFQIDLTLSGIESNAFLNPNYQYKELEQFDKNTIVFYNLYYTSGIIPYKEKIIKNKDKIYRLAILTNNKNHPFSSIADYQFSFNGNRTEQDIILMNTYINIIAMMFCDQYKI